MAVTQDHDLSADLKTILDGVQSRKARRRDYNTQMSKVSARGEVQI